MRKVLAAIPVIVLTIAAAPSSAGEAPGGDPKGANPLAPGEVTRADRAARGSAFYWLGIMHLHRGQFEEAENNIRRAVSLLDDDQGPPHPLLAEAIESLRALYDAQGRHAESRILRERSSAASN